MTKLIAAFFASHCEIAKNIIYKNHRQAAYFILKQRFVQNYLMQDKNIVVLSSGI
jgi:hypothetical protein